MKHILINAFSARRGGGKTYLANLMQYIDGRNDIVVTLLVSSDSTLASDICGSCFLDRVLFPVDNPIGRALWELVVFPIYLRRKKVDVLFCPGGTIPFSVRKGPWKTVTMFRNMIPFDLAQRKEYPLGYMRLRNWLLEKIMLRSMKSADLVIFISNFSKNIIDQATSNGIKNSIVIPHGVGDDFRVGEHSLSKRPAYLPKTDYIVYPSIVDVYKGQKEIIEAISILKNENFTVPVVLFVGELMGKYGSDVEDLIHKYGLEDDVKLIGAIPYEDMPLLYKYSLFTLYASKSENCPNILLEAMASSSAILCSNVQPMPEFAKDAVEYFDPNDPNEMALKLKQMVVNKKERDEMRKKSSKVSSQYVWSYSANKTWDVISSL